MPRDLVRRYIWILETIKRYGRITRRELDNLWSRSSLSDSGGPLSRRTFYNYRNAIEEIFNVTIECDPATFEYFLVDHDEHNRNVTDWLLNSTAVNELLANSREVSSRIFLEDVPSAREHLATVIDAVKSSRIIIFDYNNFSRSRPATGIRLEPYVLKIFRQRWYVVGFNTKERKLKTYALDRMSEVSIDSTRFVLPADFDPESYFSDSFGIVVTRSAPRQIVLRTDHLQAKYFRALPLHHSQHESVHDGFSLFEYRMRLTDDLVDELLSFGHKVTVVSPPELRAMVVDRLNQALANYTDTD